MTQRDIAKEIDLLIVENENTCQDFAPHIELVYLKTKLYQLAAKIYSDEIEAT